MTAAPSAALVLLGATGDLAQRMLLPALYNLEADGLLDPGLRVLAAARTEESRAAFTTRARASVEQRSGELDPAAWDRFATRLDYVPADATTAAGAAALSERLGDPAGAVVFFLAVSPSLYGAISARLQEARLTVAPNRVVLEKPIGRSLETSAAVNDAVTAAFDEARVFRIDHYLGKETVQNLIALRFANVLFEPLWNNLTVDHVQITVAETAGVGDRWPYYDEYGAIRDMLQNHMLQLLCLVAMEPPSALDADAVRNEKVKVLRSLRPLGRGEVAANTVRGQYGPGYVEGQPTVAYLDERGAPSDTETFVALKAEIDNWRWAGVPFFLRTGKRLGGRRTQIVIQFKAVPHSIFGTEGRADLTANRLVIDLQPDEDISLLLMNKAPGLGGASEAGMRLQALPLSLSLAEPAGGEKRRIAYERLLLDALHDNPTLFVRRDEVEAAWGWVDGVTEGWRQAGVKPKPYAGGGWGPPAAVALIERHGRTWHDD